VYERGNEIEKKEINRFYGRQNVIKMLRAQGKGLRAKGLCTSKLSMLFSAAVPRNICGYENA
jgi:hypothetical protein